MNPICIECGEEYNPKRAELGYRTCLDCGGKIADMKLYDAADVAPTGEAFPHSGRRKPSVTTVEDVKKELDEMEDEDREETRRRKEDFCELNSYFFSDGQLE